MVVDSFTLQGENFSLKNNMKVEFNNQESVTPLRGKRKAKDKWLSSTNLLWAIGTIVVWMIIIMTNSFKVMNLSDQNYQLEKKIQATDDELLSYRAQLHLRTSFEPITYNATQVLGMKLPNNPMVEIVSE